MLIGLTGTRGVGKSTIADILVKEHGFTKLHAFGPGKAATVAYFQHLGMDPETAFRSVYGDLKDTFNPLIPGDGMPRTFMEKLGKFMGVDLGPDYTLGAEVRRARRINPNIKVVVESVVYEAPLFRQLGGVIVMVERPEADGVIKGLATDAAVAALTPDFRFINSGEKANLGADLMHVLDVAYSYDEQRSRDNGLTTTEDVGC